LEATLSEQKLTKRVFAYDLDVYKKYLLPRVRGVEKDISVTVPTEDNSEVSEAVEELSETRESIKM
jgi:hypothetical protein